MYDVGQYDKGLWREAAAMRRLPNFVASAKTGREAASPGPIPIKQPTTIQVCNHSGMRAALIQPSSP